MVRYLVGLIVGATVSVSLLWVMQYLINTGENVITNAKKRHFMDFVRVERDQSVDRKQRTPKKPPKPEEAPPDVPQPQQDQVSPNAESVYVAPVGIEGGGMDIGSAFGLEASDGEYLPIVKVAPVYPRRAQSRGVEGYCTVEYTVTKNGTTMNPQVVDCSSSLFERASIEAALKFKYKPRVVDGEAIEVAGVQNKFTYELEQ
jgi:protein TonB